jgi:crossover junction endodeoxyribonuclease RusA
MSQNGNLAVTIKLPFPPSTNQYYRSIRMGKGVRTLISERGRAYRDQVVGECCVVHLTNTLLGGRLAVKVTLCPPDRRKRDLDNFNKGLLDALTHAGIWGDDSQIDDLRVVRGAVTKGGYALVEVRELEVLRMAG